MEKIDWYKKDLEELFDYLDALNDEDSLNSIIELVKDFPDLEIDWFDMYFSTSEFFLFNNRVQELEVFLNLLKEKVPDVYEKEYAFAEKDFLAYYLRNGDREKIIERLENVKQYPVAGIDVLTKDLLFQLIYFGYYDLALEYSHAVWKPIYEADELLGFPHYHFCSTIYLDALEKNYIIIKNGGSVDWGKFMKSMEQYTIDEEESVIDCIRKNLSMNVVEVDLRQMIETHDKNLNLALNIQFLKYAKEKFNFPFILGDCLFNMLTKSGLFGTNKDSYFYIPFNVLDEHFSYHFDSMFESNQTEIFGKVYGLYYVWDFLFNSELIDELHYAFMLDNIDVLKWEFIRTVESDLWRMSFVLNWPEVRTIDPSEKELFVKTFTGNSNKVKRLLNEYVKSKVIPDRVMKEKKKLKKSDDWSIFNDWCDMPATTIVKETPDPMRNELCPCGSGKKYKKCCWNKPDF